jgi:hypothetical protein
MGFSSCDLALEHNHQLSLARLAWPCPFASRTLVVRQYAQQPAPRDSLGVDSLLL